MTFLLRMTSAIGARLRAVFRRGAVEREMHEEARHLDEATERLVRRGLGETEARNAARREFGVNSALFSILQALTMRPAPGVPADDALVRIRGTASARSSGNLPAHVLHAGAQRSRVSA